MLKIKFVAWEKIVHESLNLSLFVSQDIAGCNSSVFGFAGSSQAVKNAHIKRLDNNNVPGTLGSTLSIDATLNKQQELELQQQQNLSRSISHNYLPSPVDSPQIQRHQMHQLESSPRISKASSKLALISRR